MYQQYFNFNTAPFSIAPDPHFIFMSGQHQEGLAHLLYGIKREGGFVALTGEVGTGKTMLCYCLLEQLPENVDIALVLNPKLSTQELLETICDELQIDYDEDKHSTKHLIDQINKYLLAAHAENRKTILMIDEAQNLSLDVLEQIRLLTNLETSKTKLLQIILIGQPELKQMLDLPELRQLNQRITARYHLTPLSLSETQDYISHRLTVSGGQTSLFNQAAIKKVYKLSKGIPRLINVICDKALLGTYGAEQKRVTPKIIALAASENFNNPKPFFTPFITKWLLSLLIVAFLILTTYFLTKKKHLDHPDNLSELTEQIDQKKPPSKKLIERLNKPVKTNLIIKTSKEKLLRLKSFKAILKQHNISFNHALSQLISHFDDEIPDNTSCDPLKTLGIECIYDQSDWQELIRFNRPAIMEFPVSETESTYGLLTGLIEGEPVFQFDNKKTSFPVEQVLASWNGYYLLLWQPPIKNIKIVSPQQNSDAVVWVRKILSVDKTVVVKPEHVAFFDAELKKEVIQFQKHHQLEADGIVGFRTFIQLQNKNPENNHPKLRNHN